MELTPEEQEGVAALVGRTDAIKRLVALMAEADVPWHMIAGAYAAIVLGLSDDNEFAARRVIQRVIELHSAFESGELDPQTVLNGPPDTKEG